MEQNRQEVDAALSSAAEENDAALATQKAVIDAAISALELKVEAAETGLRSDIEAAEERLDEATKTIRLGAAAAVEELQKSLEARDAAIEAQATKDREVSGGPVGQG